MLHLEQDDKFKKGPYPRTPSQQFPHEYDKPSGSTQQTVSLNTQIKPHDTTSVSHEDSFNTHFSQNEGTTILPTALVNIVHLGDTFLFAHF